jgi:coenzyme PQQ precursor peptide PqqA
LGPGIEPKRSRLESTEHLQQEEKNVIEIQSVKKIENKQIWKCPEVEELQVGCEINAYACAELGERSK